MKMHLRARAPNEGARRLAWWIARECHGNMIVAAHKLGTVSTTLQRVLAGEIVPGERLAEAIGLSTRHAISRLDWRHEAQGSWFDLPQERRAA